MSKILFLFLLSLIIFYWWRSQQIKEKAYDAVLKRCYELDVELLDGTIALSKQGLEKDKNGRWHWIRSSQFEFTSTREHRYGGKISMAGFHVVNLELDAFHIN